MESSLKAKIILCDIEGTTTSISFVKDTLFSYARKHVDVFLKNNWNNETVKSAVKDLQSLSKKDVDDKIDGAIEIIEGDVDCAEKIDSIVKNFEFLMNNDRKVAPLKTLQGLIWEQGYKDESIKGHVFEDVAKSFDVWTTTGHKVFIYSSGSVAAQKLLFEFSSAGNLLKYLSGHFDTAVGSKKEKKSYAKICKELDDIVPADVVFLTDIIEEAKAAKQAGLQTIVLNRPGNMSFTDEDKQEFNIMESFTDITFEPVTGNKRKIDDDTNDQEPPPKVVKTDSMLEENDNIMVSEQNTDNIEKKAKILVDNVDKKTVSDKNMFEKTSEPTLISDNKTESKEDEDCPIGQAEAMESNANLLPTTKMLLNVMEVEEGKDTGVLEVAETKVVKATEITDENTTANGDKMILCETDLKIEKNEKDIITENVTIEDCPDTGIEKKDTEHSKTENDVDINSIKLVEPLEISEKTQSDLSKTEIEEKNTNENILTVKCYKDNIAENKEITDNKEGNTENVINNDKVKVNDINCTENEKKSNKQEEILIENDELLLLDKLEETPLLFPLDSETAKKQEITTFLPEIQVEKSLLTEKAFIIENIELSTEKAEEKSIITDKQIAKIFPVENIKEGLENADKNYDVEKCDKDPTKIKTVEDKNGEDESFKKNGDSDKENDIEKSHEILTDTLTNVIS